MKILPPQLLIIFVIAMTALRLTLAGPILVPFPFNYLGMVLMIAGLALSYSGARLFRTLGTNIKTFDDPTLLVTASQFRWSRNPMYLGFVVFLTGLGVLLGALFPLLLMVLFAVITDRWYIPFEERALYRKFGETYADYVFRTRRWF